ncbi:AGC/PKA protein kinase [Colletotrichum fioriniae PJ7]|uniref:AGC/PKA protein kinase n=1 Tax=Colletotrichum fioriniae PJ7 TaxID=1445577 RepID=A0A010RTS6_9PEZI|nr:AGC/PKA protein kinase [Colletotrichum fioriniae PJ7]
MEVVGLVVGTVGFLPLAKECLQLASNHIGPSKHDTTELERLSGWLDDIIQTTSILHPLLKSGDAGGQPLHAQHIEGLGYYTDPMYVIQETKQYFGQIGKSMDEVRDTLGELSQAVDDSRSTAKVMQGHFQCHVEAENRQMVLDWISTRKFVLEQTDLLITRYEGIGTWFLECQNFKTWLSSPGSDERCRILFCLDGIEAGKTIITATVVNHRSEYRDRDDVAFAYVNCDYKNRFLDTSSSLLRSILRQVLEAFPSLPGELKKMHERKDPLPSTAVKMILRETINMIPSCIIVIDAIDELEVFGSNERERVLDIIDDLRQQSNVRLFITSRQIDSISCRFDPTNSLVQEVRAETQDFGTYLGGRVQNLSPLLRRHPDLRKKVKNVIISIVDGIRLADYLTPKTRFLLAHLFLDAFREDLNVPAVSKRLAEIQRDVQYAQSLPNDGNDWKRQLLCKAYDKVLDRIKMQEHGDLAMEILGWITHAKRLLKAHELITAVSLNHHGQPDSDKMY